MLQSARALAWRITRRYFSSWKGLLIAILTPVCLLLFLGPSIGNMVQVVAVNGRQVGYMTYFLPGIIAMTIFYGAVFTSGNMIVMDRVSGFSDMIKVSPNSSATITFGYVLGSIIVGSIQGVLFLVIGLCFSPVFNLSFLSVFALLFMVVGTAFFGALGFLLGSRVGFDNFSLVFALISIPFVYTSTIFVPVDYFPAVVQIIILINPVSLLVDLARGGLLGMSSWSLYFQDLATDILVDGVLFGLLFILVFVACIRMYPHFNDSKKPGKTEKKDATSSYLDADVLHAIAQEIGIKNLEEWWPLLQEGRLDALMARFPEEKINRLLEMVNQAMNRGDPGDLEKNH